MDMHTKRAQVIDIVEGEPVVAVEGDVVVGEVLTVTYEFAGREPQEGRVTVTAIVSQNAGVNVCECEAEVLETYTVAELLEAMEDEEDAAHVEACEEEIRRWHRDEEDAHWDILDRCDRDGLDARYFMR